MGQFICHQQCWGAALHPVHLVLGKPLLRMQWQKPSWCCTYKRKVTTQQGTGSGWSPNVSQQNPQRFATDHCPQKGKKKTKNNRHQDEQLPTSPQQGKMQTGFVEVFVKAASTWTKFRELTSHAVEAHWISFIFAGRDAQWQQGSAQCRFLLLKIFPFCNIFYTETPTWRISDDKNSTLPKRWIFLV